MKPPNRRPAFLPTRQCGRSCPTTPPWRTLFIRAPGGRGEALLTSDPRGYMGGFVKMAREFEAVELARRVHRLATNRHRVRLITTEAFEMLVARRSRNCTHRSTSTAVIYASMVPLACEACRDRRRNSAHARGHRPRGVHRGHVFILHGKQRTRIPPSRQHGLHCEHFPHYIVSVGERAAVALKAPSEDYLPTHTTPKVPTGFPFC